MNLAVAMTLLASVVSQDPYSTPGPYAWGQSTIQVTTPGDPVGVPAAIFYPALTEGVDAPFSPSGGPFPTVAFAHGFFLPPTWYQATLQHLATRGYVVVATESQQFTFTPDRQAYIDDFGHSIDFVIAENSRPGSMFAGRLDTLAIGTTGHSLGGGISLVQAANDPRVRANITMAAASLRDAGPLGPAPPPYADVEVTNLNIPVSLLNGSSDTLIPVSTNGQVIYDAARGPRQLPVVTGGYHSGFTDEGTLEFDSGPLPKADQLEFTRGELTSFFDLYLKGDQSAWRRQWGPERLSQTSVVSQLDPGFSISLPLGELGAAPGNTLAFNLTISNESDHADRYDLFSEDNAWNVSFPVPQSVLLNPGESAVLQGIVQIPAGVGLGATDRALISARSVLDGGTRAFTFADFRAVPEPSSAALLTLGALLGGVVWRRRRGANGSSKST